MTSNISITIIVLISITKTSSINIDNYFLTNNTIHNFTFI